MIASPLFKRAGLIGVGFLVGRSPFRQATAQRFEGLI